MRYDYAPDIQKIAEEICQVLFPYVKLNSIMCFRSYGTSSRDTIARCHALGKVMQKALGREAFYALEFLSERFDKLDEKEQIKTIMHELMHIPKAFGGGFKHHDFVSERNINKYCKEYEKIRKNRENEEKESQTKL